MCYLVYNLVVYTILADSENQLKLTPISNVSSNISYHSPVVFYLLSFPSSVLKYVTSIISRGVVYKLKPKFVLT